ncbi:hypothetical protein U1839_26620 [Sphingomonas sp. RT2P30]|uniref:hypothetical protein n=1 Tax=Parasphingomonas halimpatiens TaxID=3096162 RepID=UPI002FC76781
MAETTGKQQRQPGKDCPVCAERIKAGARRCRYCGSSLSWREHLGLGNTILALLVALVSVVTAAVPTFYNLFSSKNSDLNIAFVSTDSD